MKFYFSKFYNFTKSGWITVEILGEKKKKKSQPTEPSSKSPLQNTATKQLLQEEIAKNVFRGATFSLS